MDTSKDPATDGVPLLRVLTERAVFFADGRMRPSAGVSRIELDPRGMDAVLRRVGPEAFVVLLHLARHCRSDDRGRLVVQTSAADIAAALGASTGGSPHRGWRREAVSGHLATLFGAGFVVREAQPIVAGLRGKAAFGKPTFVLSDHLHAVRDMPDSSNDSVAGNPVSTAVDDAGSDSGASVAGNPRNAAERGVFAGGGVAASSDNAKADRNYHDDDFSKTKHHDQALDVLVAREAVGVGYGLDAHRLVRDYGAPLVLSWVLYVTKPGVARDPGAYFATQVTKGQLPPGLRGRKVDAVVVEVDGEPVPRLVVDGDVADESGEPLAAVSVPSVAKLLAVLDEVGEQRAEELQSAINAERDEETMAGWRVAATQVLRREGLLAG